MWTSAMSRSLSAIVGESESVFRLVAGRDIRSPFTYKTVKRVITVQ
jgi:hypothetical protein